jgi:hypothetical protein
MNPLPYNPRVRLLPGTRKYNELRDSILAFGEAGGVVWNRRTGNIVGGHQRYYILQDLGEEYADATVVDLDEDRERALNIRLNVPGSDWNLELLQVSYNALDEELRALTGTTDREIAEQVMAASPDAFLDDLVGMDTAPPGVGSPELKDDHPHRTGTQYFTYQIVLTGEQRDIYFAAINRAKAALNLDNSMDAITAVCEAYARS